MTGRAPGLAGLLALLLAGGPTGGDRGSSPAAPAPGAPRTARAGTPAAQPPVSPFPYLPAPTLWHFRHDMETGTPADVGASAGPTGPVRAEFTTERAASGTRSLKFTATDGRDGVIVRMERPFRSRNPAAESPTGVYQRFAMYIPQATFTNAWPGQIKLLLNRYDGSQTAQAPGWAMWGIGAEFPLGDDATGPQAARYAVAAADYGITRLPGCVPFLLPADRWFTIQLWYRHTGGVGYMRWWLDGQPVSSCGSPLLGTGDTARTLELWLGIAYAQHTTFPLVVYVDDVQAANGYIKP